MLIGSASNKPDVQLVRRIKQSLYEAMDLPDNAIITVTQLACLEEDCAPLETVFGLLRSDHPQMQYKVHKATKDIDPHDLVNVCSNWGFSVDASRFVTPVNEET